MFRLELLGVFGYGLLQTTAASTDESKVGNASHVDS
jgi:hypothetical protein